ncbi:hypothetical protein TNIN_155691 [Trichonephila inaurata madagascariensis]|uniref:Uncharacterized protein n=1 Tax=Trichonephila inaurata madagascariensis TaxID=2747483 RepID=A0A8X6YVT1_9ARAC|nr:hypothetical protein TNIN_155691 [Trichonephila inaurata madagascariensis]
MGAMRLPFGYTTVKPSSSSNRSGNATAGGRSRWAALPPRPVYQAFPLFLSSVDDSPSFHRKQRSLRYGKGRVLFGERAPEHVFFDGVSFLGEAGWRFTFFRFGCEAGAGTAGTRFNRLISSM